MTTRTTKTTGDVKLIAQAAALGQSASRTTADEIVLRVALFAVLVTLSSATGGQAIMQDLAALVILARLR